MTHQKVIIKIYSLVLLGFYFYSNVVFNFFHHHKYTFFQFEYASNCEKSIYYSHKIHFCEDYAHISKPYEKCSICDQHTYSNYYKSSFHYSFINITQYFEFVENIVWYDFLRIVCLNNKSPPSVMVLS